MKFKVIGQLFFILTLLLPTYSFGTDKDSIIIQGKYTSRQRVTKIALYAYTNKYPLSEKEVGVNQNFRIALPDSIEPGVYFLENSEGKHTKVDFIVNGKEKNIVLELNSSKFNNYPKIIESVENKIWYDYLTSSVPQIKRLEGLFEYFSNFQDQIFNRRLVKVYQKERNNYYKNFKRFVSNNSNTIAGILVLNEPYYFSNLRKKPIKRDFIRRDFFWEGIDTANPTLINSPLYRSHIEEYLSYVDDNKRHHPFTDEEKQKELRNSITVIIQQFSKNYFTKQFVIEYLMQNKLIKDNTVLIDFINNYSLQNDLIIESN